MLILQRAFLTVLIVCGSTEDTCMQSQVCCADPLMWSTLEVTYIIMHHQFPEEMKQQGMCKCNITKIVWQLLQNAVCKSPKMTQPILLTYRGQLAAVAHNIFFLSTEDDSAYFTHV